MWPHGSGAHGVKHSLECVPLPQLIRDSIRRWKLEFDLMEMASSHYLSESYHYRPVPVPVQLHLNNVR